MDCSNTSTGKRGWTSIELVIAMGIGIIALTALCVLWSYAGRHCASVLNYMALSSASRNALDVMTREVRNAQALKSVTTNRLVVTELDSRGSNFDVTFEFDPAAHALQRRAGGKATVLLTGCTSFLFSNYVASPVAGSFTLTNVVPSTNSCKVVQITWTCARALTGDQSTTESRVMAKVVKRN
jgi:Tfp pilus assembly protein PilW